MPNRDRTGKAQSVQKPVRIPKTMPNPESDTVGMPDERNLLRAASHNPPTTKPARSDIRSPKAIFPAFSPAPMTHCWLRAPGSVAIRWYWNANDARNTMIPMRIADLLRTRDRREAAGILYFFRTYSLYRSDRDYAR